MHHRTPIGGTRLGAGKGEMLRFMHPAHNVCVKAQRDRNPRFGSPLGFKAAGNKGLVCERFSIHGVHINLGAQLKLPPNNEKPPQRLVFSR